MKNPIDIGVVGCGYWGPNLVRNFRSLPECRMKTMCDLSEDRLQHLRSLYPEVQGHSNFEHLLNGDNLQAIVVATAVRLHYPMAKASLLAGKHTFVEKPLASSSAECEELIALAQKQGLVLMVGHTFLYSAAVQKIKQIVDRRGNRRHPVHLRPPAQPGAFPERHQRRLGPRAPRHLHHSAYHAGEAREHQLPGRRPCHAGNRGRDVHEPPLREGEIGHHPQQLARSHGRSGT